MIGGSSRWNGKMEQKARKDSMITSVQRPVPRKENVSNVYMIWSSSFRNKRMSPCLKIYYFLRLKIKFSCILGKSNTSSFLGNAWA